MIETGAEAPSFELPGATQDSRDQYALEEYIENGPVILSFYPFDFSPVCTSQLCDLRDIEWFDIDAEVDAFGISGDSAYAHQDFSQEHNIPFPLLSDFSGEVAESYGVLYDALERHRRAPKRSIILVDSEQTVRYTWLREDAFGEPDMDELLAAVREITG